MINKLPDPIKSLVIQQWLQGSPRDTIAANHGLSAGAVTGIVDDWRKALGSTAATELRELAVALKKVGISPAQCATGLRVAAIITKLGVREENIELFLSEVYNRCSEQGIRPENIASYLTDLLQFSKTVPFSGMSDHIQKMTYEKASLQQRIGELNDEKWELIRKICELDTRRHIALEESKTTFDTLKWYSDLNTELRKHGIPIDDVSQLVRVISGIKQYGFDVQKVLTEFSNLELFKARCQGYQGSVIRLKSQYDTLNQDCVFLQQMVSSYNQRLSIYDELESMGFGLKELKLLWHTIREIADANNIPLHNAVTRFFNDINEHYDDKLGFESEANRLRVEVNKLNQLYDRRYAELSLFSNSGPLLLGLIQAGIKDKDIMCLAELLKSDSIITTREERQILIDEVKKYGSIKSIIKNLAYQESELRNVIASLETKKQALNEDNSSMFVYSEKSASLFDTPSRKATKGLLSMIAYLMHLFNVRMEKLQELDDVDLGEFAPIIMAARGEPVRQIELKKSIIKAVELVLKELHVEDKLVGLT